MKIKKNYIYALLGLFVALCIICINQSVMAKKWQNRYFEKNLDYISEVKKSERFQDNWEETYNRLIEKQNEYDKLKQWSENVYCEVTYGNAYIKYSSSKVSQVVWKLYIDQEELTRPPVKTVDCRGK